KISPERLRRRTGLRSRDGQLPADGDHVQFGGELCALRQRAIAPLAGHRSTRRRGPGPHPASTSRRQQLGASAAGARATLSMNTGSENGWTGGQYSLFRAVFGLYLFVHFVELVPWGAELFSNRGVLPHAAASPLIHLFPN